VITLSRFLCKITVEHTLLTSSIKIGNFLLILLLLPDGNRLGQLCFSGSCDPSDFRREVGDVVLLLLQGSLRHEDGEVAVLDAQLLDLAVEKRLKKI
jgi:hypothetical protein